MLVTSEDVSGRITGRGVSLAAALAVLWKKAEAESRGKKKKS
jgi:hypothetical protein